MSFDFRIFVEALASTALLRGALITILLAAAVQTASFLLSLPVASGLFSPKRPLRLTLKLYVWFFRAAPLLLILLFTWNGLPQIFPALRSRWFNPFLAAFIAMTIAGVAYNAEIMRSALASVGTGQREAAAALGLHRFQIFFLVVLPQAMRVAMPPLMNEFISTLKAT